MVTEWRFDLPSDRMEDGGSVIEVAIFYEHYYNGFTSAVKCLV